MSRDYVLHPFASEAHLQIDYARDLNEQQMAAVTAPPGPALIIAGAGAGKTRTLIYRVAYLLEQGVPAERLLLLTFTNKAAHEMMRRVADLLGKELAALWGGTFHAIANRILRAHARRVGYDPDYTILDREDAKVLLRACLADAAIDTKASRFPKADVVGDIISLAVNRRQTIADVLDKEYKHFAHLAPQIVEIRRRYEIRKRAANVMDFDDLLVMWLRLLTENADVCEQYQRRFQFLLVDEYQDTNQLQSDVIDLLAARHRNVMVVGDDAQSIYSWRGANFLNILEFPKRYPEAKLYKIEVNYRSTPEILALANAAIAPNEHQFAKELAPVRKCGEKPVLVVCSDANQQAAFVAQRVLELRDEGTRLNRMAVLYRSHFHALELQLELTRRNIPFNITSGIRFFEQAHIKDVIAFLKLVCNPCDELSFKRIALMLPGVGSRSADRLWEAATQAMQNRAPARPALTGQTVSCAEASSGVQSPPAATSDAPGQPGGPTRGRGGLTPISGAIAGLSDLMPRRARRHWAELVDTFARLEAEPTCRQAAEMIGVVLAGDYKDYLQANYTNHQSRLEELEQLAVFAMQFVSPEEFLAQVALLSNLEAEDARPADRDDEKLRLSTVHQAKGLEFDVVFVIMLCDGLFPSAYSINRVEALEEERRLFYVAITRARNELYVVYPLVRITQGYRGDIVQRPSRFLCDIPVKLWDEWIVGQFNAYELSQAWHEKQRSNR
jgi:DNA helicase-2/ATP-dependent DNA helicase PcrA